MIVAAVLIGSILAPGVASAGRTHYGWLFGTEVLPERGAEIESWVAEENRKKPGNVSESSLWWAALVGITDQLELALPVELAWERVGGEAPSFTLTKFGVEARYRLVSQDPVDAPPFAPLVRVAIMRDVTARDSVRVETDLVASTTTQSGSVHALVDLGVAGDISGDVHHFELRPGAGVSLGVVGDLRLGAEVFAQLSLDSGATSWAVVGPNLAWSHGRFWLSAAYGIGVYQIKDAPRIVWGIAF